MRAATDAPGQDCLIADDMDEDAAIRLAQAIRKTKPLGSFSASFRSVGIEYPLQPCAVFGQYLGEDGVKEHQRRQAEKAKLKEQL